jgi:hypothetical protein
VSRYDSYKSHSTDNGFEGIDITIGGDSGSTGVHKPEYGMRAVDVEALQGE